VVFRAGEGEVIGKLASESPGRSAGHFEFYSVLVGRKLQSLCATRFRVREARIRQCGFSHSHFPAVLTGDRRAIDLPGRVFHGPDRLRLHVLVRRELPGQFSRRSHQEEDRGVVTIFASAQIRLIALAISYFHITSK
jgi:hypothetical protein